MLYRYRNHNRYSIEPKRPFGTAFKLTIGYSVARLIILTVIVAALTGLAFAMDWYFQ